MRDNERCRSLHGGRGLKRVRLKMPIEGTEKIAKYPKLFRWYGSRVGRNWLASIDISDRKIFGEIGYRACGRVRGFQFLPKTGGHCRARTAKRDHKGRFVRG